MQKKTKTEQTKKNKKNAPSPTSPTPKKATMTAEQVSAVVRAIPGWDGEPAVWRENDNMWYAMISDYGDVHRGESPASALCGALMGRRVIDSLTLIRQLSTYSCAGGNVDEIRRGVASLGALDAAFNAIRTIWLEERDG